MRATSQVRFLSSPPHGDVGMAPASPSPSGSHSELICLVGAQTGVTSTDETASAVVVSTPQVSRRQVLDQTSTTRPGALATDTSRASTNRRFPGSRGEHSILPGAQTRDTSPQHAGVPGAAAKAVRLRIPVPLVAWFSGRTHTLRCEDRRLLLYHQTPPPRAENLGPERVGTRQSRVLADNDLNDPMTKPKGERP